MSEAPQQAQAVPHRRSQRFYIIYIMRNGVMRDLARFWLWSPKCALLHLHVPNVLPA
jgi:hypothetical protein